MNTKSSIDFASAKSGFGVARVDFAYFARAKNSTNNFASAKSDFTIANVDFANFARAKDSTNHPSGHFAYFKLA